MSANNVALIGSKGAGKSTTLLETYYLAVSKGIKAIYMDLTCERDSCYDYHSGEGLGFYFFVDNAQLLRRKQMTGISGMLSQGKVCLAFSSSFVDRGNAQLNCPVETVHTYRFVPFTDEEINQYICNNCPGRSYIGKTTLPIVVKECLVGEQSYDDVVSSMVEHVFIRLCTSFGQELSAIFKYLYSFLHIGNKLNTSSISKLIKCGLVYKKADGNYELVFERKHVHLTLCSTARAQHDLFMKFNIGGAEELQFSECCHRGQISAVCRGRCFTINGKSRKQSTLTINCNEFLEQDCIGDVVTVSLSAATCCVIKLAKNHPAIDFIIYESKGPVRTKVLYFIQVSASRYQDRTKKLSAVTDFNSDLSGSPYKYYKDMFGVTTAEVYYIYSSPTAIPVNDSFSTSRKDKDCVYFHQLEW